MDNPNITMEEYIRLQEEKVLSRAIVLDNTLTSDAALSCGPTVSPLNNNEIDFRISFDISADEDYTVVYDENSFSYKIINVNNLKTASENDNDKVNMPSFPSPEPEVSYFNDLDFFKDFENEFPAIVYNDALTSKLDLLTEPTISPRHIDEFNLKDETSLSQCDEEEQNVLYFNDLFPFNVIYPDNIKLDTDNNNKIDIERPSRDMSVTPIPDVINVNAQGSNKLSETRTTFGLHPYHFTYPERRLTMEEMVYKFIDEGKREHEEMRAFIREFRTSNELLFKEKNNSLSELRFEVHGLSKVIDNNLTSNCKVKGVTTSGGKMTTQDIQDDNTNIHTKEPLAIHHDKPVELE
ncbi:hypothetical protein Tco_0209557 [Tanacetum coccineum]